MSNHKLTKKDIEQLLIDYKPLIKKVAYRMPIYPHYEHLTRDDYEQEIYYRVYTNMLTYTPYHRCSARTFIYNAIKMARGNILGGLAKKINTKVKHNKNGFYVNSLNDLPEGTDFLCPKPTPNETAQTKILNKRINHYLICLSPRETIILCQFYGFNGHIQLTLDEIAKEQKVTGQYIHIIKNRALRKVRLLIKDENERERKERRRQNRANRKMCQM